jgi:hypothetical protein
MAVRIFFFTRAIFCLCVPQYLITTLFYRVQLPFSQSGVLIELSNGYLKVVARLGLLFVWNEDDSLLVRGSRVSWWGRVMGRGAAGQSFLVKWGKGWSFLVKSGGG